MCIGVVLAAGASSRFPGNKLLAKYGGRALVAWAAAAVREALGEAYLVVGHMALEVKAAAGRVDGVVYNPWWREGLSTSVKAAVAAFAEEDCILFMPGDMPLVRPDTIRKVARCGGGIAVPTYRGARGNPVACCRRLYGEVLTRLTGDVGLRALINAAPTYYVEVDDPGVLIDVDTPQDLQRLQNSKDHTQLKL
ncbi:MAG: nucleotidyltransferase family protein [Pyrobaculum sp.]